MAMRHLDVSEVLILLGVVAFIGLAVHNWYLSHNGHHHHQDDRRLRKSRGV
jgi:FtsZ-interacting cell division protein ZipA